MTVVILAVVVVSGGVDSSARTVTVQETPIGPPAHTSKVALTGHEIYARDAPGVVFVKATGVNAPQSPAELLRGEGGQEDTATGSGFEIDGDGTILTNWHVVENATKVIVGFEHGKTVEAGMMGKDPSDDLAVLRVPTDDLTLHPLTLGDSSQIQVGDPVFAIGNPFGLERTFTTGVISALERQIQAPNGVTIGNALQTDAPINPGNSGGPLLNEAGEVIGINSQIETGSSSGGNVGIAFAIPISTVIAELKRLGGKRLKQAVRTESAGHHGYLHDRPEGRWPYRP